MKLLSLLSLLFPTFSNALSHASHAGLRTVDISTVADVTNSRFRFEVPSDSQPQQLKLSLTGSTSEMFVTFVLPNVTAPCSDAKVTIMNGGSFPASYQTYSAGVIGWSGSIYVAKLTGLTPGNSYSYSAFACGKASLTPNPTFKAAPVTGPNVQTRVIVKADMGTVVPMGFAVAEQIEKDNAANPFDLAVLAGDLSYATVDPPHNEFEEVWDAWGRMIEPYVSLMPFMANVGNHEHTPGSFTNSSGKYNVDYAAYIARYGAVPDNGNGPLWYSYDFGSVHYTYIDSEESQEAGSPQLTWLQADLAAVDRSKTPWVLVFQHRPLLCSTQGEEGDHIPGGKFLTLLEPTLLANKVDLVVTGHEHLYERMNAVAKGVVVANATGTRNAYVNPTAPVYVVQGTAGAFVGGDWMNPQPAWSAFRDGTTYGYGQMVVDGATSIDWTYMGSDGKIIDHWRIEKS